MSPPEEKRTAIWRPGDRGPAVEYSLAAMEEIRSTIVRSFHQISRGGLEIGGVLFGTHARGVVRIETWQRISCRHALGPAFKLNPEDEAELEQLLSASGQDPRFGMLIPVGWFLSRTRSEIALTDADQTLHRRYFGQPWQIAIVFRPARANSVRGAVFSVDGGGKLQPAGDLLELVPQPSLAANGRRARDGGRPAPEGGEPEGQAPPAAPPPARSVRREAPVPRVAKPAPKRWLAVPLCLAAAAAGFFSRPFILPEKPPQPLLRVVERNGQLTLGWDGSDPSVRAAQQAVLSIDDGGNTRDIALDAAMLSQGSFTYGRRTENVKLRLLIPREGSPPLEEFVQFVAPPAPPRQEPESFRVRVRQLEQENAKLRAEAENAKARAGRLESQLIRHIRQSAAPAPGPGQPPEAPR